MVRKDACFVCKGPRGHPDLELVCQVEGRGAKDAVNHGLQVGTVQRWVDSTPSAAPLLSTRHRKPLSKQELGDLHQPLHHSSQDKNWNHLE